MRFVVQQRHPEPFGEEPRGSTTPTPIRIPGATRFPAQPFREHVPAGGGALEFVGVNERALENHDVFCPQGGWAWASRG